LIEIDGSYGEGGGQILRTALALSAILRKPFTISHIRSKRKNPGLQAQHLEAVEALARITEAQTEGVKFGSQKITFIPQEIHPGEYQFEVKTAGSATLLLQAIFLPLCFSKASSRVILIGGTHVQWSPSFHYLSEVFLPAVKGIGVSAEAAIEKWGFYPKGGGRIRLKINPIQELNPISLVDRGSLKKIRGISAKANLPRHVAERQKEQALRRIRSELGMDGEIILMDNVSSNGPGSFLFLLAEYEKVVAGFSSLGVKGKAAEKVADEAFDLLKEYVESDGCIDPHLADQLVPFMALAKGDSSFTTTQMSEHLFTNIWVVERFLKVKVRERGEEGRPGRVEISQ
jgi:RNA 3'-phosphate cyclase